MASRKTSILRIILFALVIIMINASPEVLSSPFSGETQVVVRGNIALLTFFMTYLALLAFITWEKSGSITDLGLQDDGDVSMHLLIGGVSGLIAVLVVALFAFVFGGELSAGVDVDRLTSVIILAVPVSVLEELSYRGYLMSRMDSLWGRNSALIMSSIVFSLSHFDWWTPLGVVPIHQILLFSLNLFLGGIVLGSSYYLTKRRLWIPIGFHFAWNITAFSLFPVYPIDSVMNPELFQIEWGLTTIVGFIVGISIIWTLVGKVKSQEL